MLNTQPSSIGEPFLTIPQYAVLGAYPKRSSEYQLHRDFILRPGSFRAVPKAKEMMYRRFILMQRYIDRNPIDLQSIDESI